MPVFQKLFHKQRKRQHSPTYLMRPQAIIILILDPYQRYNENQARNFKRPVLHKQVEFIPGMQSWFDIQKKM